MAEQTKPQRVPLIAGNWKMNLDHLRAIGLTQKLAWTLKDAKHDFSAVEVAVFPPFTDLRSVQTLVGADKLQITYGAQDISEHESGAYTGEVSGEFIAKLDAKYVLVGHSERREYHHETDSVVAAKTAAALKYGLIPVICVGDTAEDLEKYGSSKVPCDQISTVLVANAEFLRKRDPETQGIVIAYEPVWAIGSGEPATCETAQNVAKAIRETVEQVLSTELNSELGEAWANKTRILYGGSVKVENIAGFMAQPDIDGALVGGASLNAESFAGIAQYQKHVSVYN